MEYRPDRWMMVSLTTEGKVHYRIFATWGGGYLNGDEWKLNSGVTSLKETEDQFYFEGSSGSTYICNKKAYGSTGYGLGVLHGLITKSLKQGTVIEMLPEETDFTSLAYE
jgi:hypothetical protein